MQSNETITLNFAFKIAIFDLDDTLWDGEKLFNDVKYILDTLKNNGVKLFIASYNLEAPLCCSCLTILDYFDEIIYDRRLKKSEMVKKILDKFTDINESEVVFFDDNIHNIHDVKVNTAVSACHVTGGITWNNVKYDIVVSDRENIYIGGELYEDFHFSDNARYSKATINIRNLDE